MRRLIAAILCVACSAGSAAAAEYRLLELGGTLVKWGPAALGTGAEVSYGFAGRAEQFPDAINCRAIDPITRLDVAAAPGFAASVERAFAVWSAAADVTFRPAGPGEQPDILIGAQGRPDHIAYANVWPARDRAVAGVAPLKRATICLNPELAWVPDDAAPGQADFGTVLAHEIGHALGLDHPGPTGALMGYNDQGDIDAPMAGDRAGVARLYGSNNR